MRLFAAVVPPEHVLADLLAATASVRRDLPDARWPAADRMHLTLARMRQPTDVRSAVEELATYAGPTWVADRLELVRSRLGPHPSYETLASWPLAGSPAP